MRGIFNFDKMITPLFIKLFFWLGVLATILGGFGLIGFGLISEIGNFIHVIGGVVALFLGPLVIRVYCEMLIVVFKMQESLVQIRDLQGDNRKYSTPQETVDVT